MVFRMDTISPPSPDCSVADPPEHKIALATGPSDGRSVRTRSFRRHNVEFASTRPRYESRNGAPRPVKMGTIASPQRHDAAIHRAFYSVDLRCRALLHCAGMR